MNVQIKDHYFEIINNLETYYGENHRFIGEISSNVDLFEIRNLLLDFFSGSYLIYAKKENLLIPNLDEVIAFFLAPWKKEEFQSVLTYSEYEASVSLKNEIDVSKIHFFYPALAKFVACAFNTFPYLLKTLKGETYSKEMLKEIDTIQLEDIMFDANTFLEFYGIRLQERFDRFVEMNYSYPEDTREFYRKEDVEVFYEECKKDEKEMEQSMDNTLNVLAQIIDHIEKQTN